jgi:hypothetical protein
MDGVPCQFFLYLGSPALSTQIYHSLCQPAALQGLRSLPLTCTHSQPHRSTSFYSAQPTAAESFAKYQEHRVALPEDFKSYEIHEQSDCRSVGLTRQAGGTAASSRSLQPRRCLLSAADLLRALTLEGPSTPGWRSLKSRCTDSRR